MHFDQLCTHERCRGYWAMRFDEGAFGEVPLAGAKAVIAFESPRHMIDGNWIEVVIIDEGASPAQRLAVETILTGQAGGPWQTLARFVGRRLETRYAPIEMADEGATKRLTIRSLLDAVVTQIRGRDRSRPVMFENIFNQIHAPLQVLATGTTRYDDGEIVIRNDGTHGLFSNFDWSVAPAHNGAGPER
jgi:hypothetical protein